VPSLAVSPSNAGSSGPVPPSVSPAPTMADLTSSMSVVPSMTRLTAGTSTKAVPRPWKSPDASAVSSSQSHLPERHASTIPAVSSGVASLIQTLLHFTVSGSTHPVVTRSSSISTCLGKVSANPSYLPVGSLSPRFADGFAAVPGSFRSIHAFFLSGNVAGTQPTRAVSCQRTSGSSLRAAPRPGRHR